MKFLNKFNKNNYKLIFLLIILIIFLINFRRKKDKFTVKTDVECDFLPQESEHYAYISQVQKDYSNKKNADDAVIGKDYSVSFSSNNHGGPAACWPDQNKLGIDFTKCIKNISKDPKFDILEIDDRDGKFQHKGVINKDIIDVELYYYDKITKQDEFILSLNMNNNKKVHKIGHQNIKDWDPDYNRLLFNYTGNPNKADFETKRNEINQFFNYNISANNPKILKLRVLIKTLYFLRIEQINFNRNVNQKKIIPQFQLKDNYDQSNDDLLAILQKNEYKKVYIDFKLNITFNDGGSSKEFKKEYIIKENGTINISSFISELTFKTDYENNLLRDLKKLVVTYMIKNSTIDQHITIKERSCFCSFVIINNQDVNTIIQEADISTPDFIKISFSDISNLIFKPDVGQDTDIKNPKLTYQTTNMELEPFNINKIYEIPNFNNTIDIDDLLFNTITNISITDYIINTINYIELTCTELQDNELLKIEYFTINILNNKIISNPEILILNLTDLVNLSPISSIKFKKDGIIKNYNSDIANGTFEVAIEFNKNMFLSKLMTTNSTITNMEFYFNTPMCNRNYCNNNGNPQYLDKLAFEDCGECVCDPTFSGSKCEYVECNVSGDCIEQNTNSVSGRKLFDPKLINKGFTEPNNPCICDCKTIQHPNDGNNTILPAYTGDKCEDSIKCNREEDCVDRGNPTNTNLNRVTNNSGILDYNCLCDCDTIGEGDTENLLLKDVNGDPLPKYEGDQCQIFSVCTEDDCSGNGQPSGENRINSNGKYNCDCQCDDIQNPDTGKFFPAYFGDHCQKVSQCNITDCYPDGSFDESNPPELENNFQYRVNDNGTYGCVCINPVNIIDLTELIDNDKISGTSISGVEPTFYNGKILNNEINYEEVSILKQ